MLPQTLGVIGLGDLGGSVAWGATRVGVPRVLGWSPRPRDGAAAVRAGAITEFVHDAASVCRQAEFVVFTTPADETSRLLEQHAGALTGRGVYCTDVAGVKRPIVESASKLGLEGVFAGSHPLVDDSAEGFVAASPHLMRGVLVYVTPVGDGHAAADEVRDFWTRALGAHPVVLPADRHDDLVAWTVHLPHTVMAALASALADDAPPGVSVPPGVLAATRLADVDPQRWGPVLLANRERLLPVLDTFRSALDALRNQIEARDVDALRARLDAAASWRRGHGS